jgi:SAM-dependent methyltransferase
MKKEAFPPAAAVGSASAAVYGSEYSEWKHWTDDSFAALSMREACDFGANLRKAGRGLPAGSQMLDIGFGNGAFLEYGRRRGWQMSGTEANPGLVERARQKGFNAVHAEALAGFADSSFDLVSAFDVLEHIPLDALPGFLSEVRRVLKPGGLFLGRFPNGDSPFGCHLQNGDPTHVTTIGTRRARYLAAISNLEVVYLWHEVQALWAGITHTPHRLFAVPMKKLMNLFLNLVYSPRNPLPFCSPNLVMILRKPGAATG